MSKISDIYDELTTVVSTALPTHSEISNPYFPETDTDLSYNKAYGIAFSDGVNLLENRDSGTNQLQQDFIISIFRRIFATRRDRDTRKTTEKDLFEDFNLVIKAIGEAVKLRNGQLGIRADYTGHGGIEFIRVDRQDIIAIRLVVEMEYHEEFNLCG